MAAPAQIANLVERFKEQIDSYKYGKYKETQLRREFVDPFFESLGWDLENKKGYAERYKEVVHEDAVKIGKATKAPDYSFRIGDTRKFFLEAKKPSVDIKRDANSAYQLRRYGWSAKLSLSILTNFEWFAVYDCHVKPTKKDQASHSRIMLIRYSDYEEKWDEIAGLFSRKAILKGSFDKFAISQKGKKGTAEVDVVFLREIERWRELLAKNIALRNSWISQRDINFAVQKTIDRIIFLRICEDRGVEEYETLRSAAEKKDIYKQLFEIFLRADDLYNSGIFHFKPEKGRENVDIITPNLNIDDKVLKDIIKNLYYPDSPYEFSVVPSDILGQVYEQFLGKIIRLTKTQRALIEYKPEVRKAGGVYYTPSYVVDFIVAKAVGQVLNDKTAGPNGTANNIKILDPACGSGSFLLSAYQHLLDWHLSEYTKAPHKWSKGAKPRIYKAQDGGWKLTAEERKRILLNNIFGVDVDNQAVEVTKLSLLLKVLEGEDRQTIHRQMPLFRERILPDLVNNIKCGNSLIGPDYYQSHPMDLLNEDDIFNINAFDWENEFTTIMKGGGFSVIIGNPPWGADFCENKLEYLRRTNKDIIVRMIDSFMYFVNQSSKKLRKSGYFGMILPDVILYQTDNEKLRNYLINEFSINFILNMGNVFDKVSRPASIIIFRKTKPRSPSIKVADLTNISKLEKPLLINKRSIFKTVKQNSLKKIPKKLFITNQPARYTIWSKINEVPNKYLSEFVDIDGIQRG